MLSLAPLVSFILAVNAIPVPGAGSSSKTLPQVWKTSGNAYPTVFIHGLLGWGENHKLLGIINYWGGITQNILDDLRGQGYTVAAPSLGPLSSNWERACEAYAQLTGTVTDYGIARSSQFGHQRFGDDHTGAAILSGFQAGQEYKINLVGHSMGGPTQRMLAHLLQYGSQTEMDACHVQQVVCSPLFWTNRTQSVVNGVFALSGVHQGSPFDDVLQSNAGFLQFFKDLVLALVGANNWDNINLYNMQLGHWGLNQNPDEKFFDYLERILQSPWVNSKSNALFDLSVAGVNDPLLSFVRNSPQTTYFSVAALSTAFVFGNVAVAEVTTFPLLAPSANIIGDYSNPNLPILTTYSRQEWRMNDGLVPIASSRGPTSGYNSFGLNMLSGNQNDLANSAVASTPPKGVYNFVYTWDNTDHIAMVGIFDLVPGLRKDFYNNVVRILGALDA